MSSKKTPEQHNAPPPGLEIDARQVTGHPIPMCMPPPMPYNGMMHGLTPPMYYQPECAQPCGMHPMQMPVYNSPTVQVFPLSADWPPSSVSINYNGEWFAYRREDDGNAELESALQRDIQERCDASVNREFCNELIEEMSPSQSQELDPELDPELCALHNEYMQSLTLPPPHVPVNEIASQCRGHPAQSICEEASVTAVVSQAEPQPPSPKREAVAPPAPQPPSPTREGVASPESRPSSPTREGVPSPESQPPTIITARKSPDLRTSSFPELSSQARGNTTLAKPVAVKSKIAYKTYAMSLSSAVGSEEPPSQAAHDAKKRLLLRTAKRDQPPTAEKGLGDRGGHARAAHDTRQTPFRSTGVHYSHAPAKGRGSKTRRAHGSSFTATDIITISRAIKRARLGSGLTIHEIAKRSAASGGEGVAADLIASYENATVREVSADVLRVIGRVLGVRITAHLYDCDQRQLKSMGNSWVSPENTRMVRYII